MADTHGEECKKTCKYEYTHRCPVEPDGLCEAIFLFPKVAGQGPVWQHPAKLDLGTSSNSRRCSQQTIPSPRTQLSPLLQPNSIKTKLLTKSFLIVLFHILHNTRQMCVRDVLKSVSHSCIPHSISRLLMENKFSKQLD